MVSGPCVDATPSRITLTSWLYYDYYKCYTAPPYLPVVVPFVIRDGSGKRASRVDGATVDGDQDHVVCGQRAETAAGKSDH